MSELDRRLAAMKGGERMHRIAFEQKGFIDFEYRVENPVVPIIHSHAFYEVYYFHQGKCNYLIGDKIYMLSPGDLFFMYGMTLHGAKADPAIPYIRSIIHFEPTFLKPFFGMTHAVNVLRPFQEHRNYRINLSGPYKEEFEGLLARMHDLQSRELDRLRINRLQLAFVDLLYFIYELYTNPGINKLSGSSDKEQSVQRIISFIEQHYTSELNLEQMSEQLHFSKSYLAKLFKEVTGFTIFDFIYRRRINQARIMFLTNPKRSVTEVCMETGFKHLAHFSRIFKAHAGMNPEDYKKQIKDIVLDGVIE